VGIANRYALDGPGIEPVAGRFSALFQTGPGAHLASYTMGTGSLPGVKRPGRGVNNPSSSSAEVKERTELYLYSHSGPFEACSRVNCAFIFTHCTRGWVGLRLGTDRRGKSRPKRDSIPRPPSL